MEFVTSSRMWYNTGLSGSVWKIFSSLWQSVGKEHSLTGQVGLGVGSWPSNRVTEGSNPKGTRLYFVILLKNVEKIFDWH